MADQLRFQVLTLPGQPWETYRRQVLRIEELGFDAVAVPDHFIDWANPPAPWLECWSIMAALAVETTSVRLATNVVQIPLRNPGMLAHQAVTVDHISGGRVELGLGTGLMIDAGTEMIGLPNWSNGERVARFGEYVELVGLLLAQEETSYDGDYYSAAGAVMNPASLQQPRLPLIAAALGPKMMAHTAAHADGWNTMSFDPDFGAQLDELSARGQAMDALLAEAGRPIDALRRQANIYDAEARAAGGRLRVYDDEDLLARMVNGLRDAGFTEIGLYHPSDPSQVDAFERIAAEVIPGLR